MFKKISLLLTISILLSGCVGPFKNLRITQKSGLHVSTLPQATVYLDGDSLGTTPVKVEDLTPGEHTVKISPLDPALQPYETKVELTPGTITVIDRSLTANPSEGQGYILTFEPLKDKKDIELSINTVPESVTIKIDDSPQGFTPQNLDNVTAGEHTIVLSTPGYNDKTVYARTLTGYRLKVIANLSRAIPTAMITPTPLATPSGTLVPSLTPTPSTTLALKTPTPTPTIAGVATSSATTVKKPYVEILNTPTGFLKVRNAPVSGDEIARVLPGEKHPYLETGEAGWLNIQYAPGKTGWVSSQYAKLVK